VDNEVENRLRQKQMLEILIKEKQTELERYFLYSLPHILIVEYIYLKCFIAG
jgi:hypothetical protein